MVGTAVYQVGRASFIQPENFSASNPGAHQIDASAASDAVTAAICPWIWNSGITFRQQSAGASGTPMFCAEAAWFDCSSGTIFGRDVVPDVCRFRAVLSGPWAAPDAGSPVSAPNRVNFPAG